MEVPSTSYTGYMMNAQKPTTMSVTLQLSDIPEDEPGFPTNVIFDTGAMVSTAEKSWLLKNCPTCKPFPLRTQAFHMHGVGSGILPITEFVYADLIFKGQIEAGPVDVRVAAVIHLMEEAQISMLLGMDIARLHKIDVDQKRQKLVFRGAGDAEVTFLT